MQAGRVRSGKTVVKEKINKYLIRINKFLGVKREPRGNLKDKLLKT